jgi:hypothetical protein
LFTHDNLPGVLQQNHEDLKRLLLQPDPHSSTAQFTGSSVLAAPQSAVEHLPEG